MAGKELCEEAVVLQSHHEQLLAIIHYPKTDHSGNHQAVILIPGGYQTRVGAHRMSVLLARHFAREGVAVIRFDPKGMGDSSGPFQHFSQQGDDIDIAITALKEAIPDIKHLYLWGLCDAATSALLYAQTASNISGLLLVNPWIYDTKIAAQTALTSYYPQRLRSRQMWKKLFTGQLKWIDSIKELAKIIGRQLTKQGLQSHHSQDEDLSSQSLNAIERFSGKIHLLLCEQDATAKQFKLAMTKLYSWEKMMSKYSIALLEHPKADHTFSREKWQRDLQEWSLNSVRSCL